ncbi:unnamed protein product [Rotaria sp. Silwood2]|nr:unnamed protein product [Rotaria sp. Silwood2]CAF3400116.1 unnamed protein product [Rotaria sp. Silwood2]
MSAYSNLLGLYPTSKEKLDLILSEIEQDNKWPEVLPWQPIPVHTVPKSIDYALYNKTSSWTNTFVLSQLQQIADFSFYYLFNSFETNKIIAGPIIGNIMENIENLILNESTGWKAKIYSGHDATIVPILSYFQANYIHQPVYCSTLFFDLYHIPG